MSFRPALVLTAGALVAGLAAPPVLASYLREAPSVASLAGLSSAQMRAVAGYQGYLDGEARQRRLAAVAVGYAYKQLGKPYVFGGSGPSSFDCSGLTMRAWGQAGIRLAHYVPTQYRETVRKVRINELQPGDLVMFSDFGHVGIYVGGHRFIHAPHEGDHVRVEAMTGWRVSAFAGAVRPGAQAYRAWPGGIVAAERDVAWWRAWLTAHPGYFTRR